MAWLIAVVSALLGFAIRAAYDAWEDRRSFLRGLAELVVELREVQELAERRVRSSSTIAGDLKPPLPVEAWRLMLSTGKLTRLPEGTLHGVRDLYGEIVKANHLGGHWIHFLEISRLSDDEDVYTAYDTQAALVMREPCRPVVARIGPVIAGLEDFMRVGKRRLPTRGGARGG